MLQEIGTTAITRQENLFLWWVFQIIHSSLEVIMKNIKLGRFMIDNTGTLHGRINGLGIGSVNVISEAVKSASGKEYIKLIADPMGEAYEVGAAFLKEKDGLVYYSVSLESPVFLTPLSAALFPDKDEENILNLVWSRAESKGLSADAAAEAQNPRRFVGAGAATATL
ncbi:MAG: DUF736 family protein [Alphaproteobacteria bacterium]